MEVKKAKPGEEYMRLLISERCNDFKKVDRLIFHQVITLIDRLNNPPNAKNWVGMSGELTLLVHWLVGGIVKLVSSARLNCSVKDRFSHYHELCVLLMMQTL